jgi:hypothetical protein
MLEKELRANWDAVFYPEPEPEVETFGEEVEPVEPPVLLAAGTSGTVSDAGAAFGVFPQMKPRRAGRSDIGANLPVLAADAIAGAGKGAISGTVGLPGDLLALGRGLYEIGKRGGNEGALDAFLRGMQEGTIVPTSDDVDKWLTKNIGPVVPAGVQMQGARETAASVGRVAGEIVADPFVAVKGAKAIARGAKALAPKAGEMLDAYMQRTGLQQNLMAYHGTPHNFEKFDAAKIGTGEGAQAYGYGLYFAERKGVADSYRIGLTAPAPQLTQEIENVLPATLKGKAPDWADAIQSGQTFDDLAATLKQQWQKSVLEQKKQELDSIITRQQSGGVLYTVNIPDSVVAKMLDFDAPISGQSQEIQALAKQYNIQPEDLGGDLLAAAEGKTAAGAQRLREAGITGVRYLDQGSRGQRESTRNIVVFPGSEDQVKILKREGQGK